MRSFPSSIDGCPARTGLADAADYPLMERLDAEVEEAKRRGLSEEGLFDLLVKLIEVEMIKRRRKPLTDLERLIRQIMKETIPPEGVEERRKCMFTYTNVLFAALKSRCGASYKLISLLPTKKFSIAISVPLIIEYEDVLRRGKLSGSITEKDTSSFIDFFCHIGDQ